MEISAEGSQLLLQWVHCTNRRENGRLVVPYVRQQVPAHVRNASCPRILQADRCLTLGEVGVERQLSDSNNRLFRWRDEVHVGQSDAGRVGTETRAAHVPDQLIAPLL